MSSAIAEKKTSSRRALKARPFDASVFDASRDVAIMFARDYRKLLHLLMRKRAGGAIIESRNFVSEAKLRRWNQAIARKNSSLLR